MYREDSEINRIARGELDLDSAAAEVRWVAADGIEDFPDRFLEYRFLTDDRDLEIHRHGWIDPDERV